MNIFLATHHPEIELIMEKLETEKGIKELAKDLKVENLREWAQPITIVDQAMYRERLIEKAQAAKPDVIILYDKLPGIIELEVLLEEIRLEVHNSQGQDTRVIFLTSLEQGAPLLRKAVEIGIWDIISGQDIYPIDIIKRIYCPTPYAEVARFRLAADDKCQVKFIPKYIEKEKIVEVAKVQEVEVEKIVEKEKLVRVGNTRGVKETILIWSPFELGKTFLAVNLAVALAYQGIKTMLIDADIQNRSLENFFNLEGEERYAFLKALKNGDTGEEVIKKCYKYKKNLHVLSLPSGKTEMPKVIEEEFIRIYDTLRLTYDVFIIDGCKDLSSPLTKGAYQFASRVLMPVTQDPNRAQMIRITLKELAGQGMAVNKIEPLLNMYVGTNVPEKQEIAEILGLKLLTITIPAVLETAYRSIADGIPAYDDKKKPVSFREALDSLADYINSEGNFQQIKSKKKKKFGLF